MNRYTIENRRISLGFRQRGVMAFEMAIISIVVVIGCITGLAMFRDALAYDCRDTGNAIRELDTSYSAGPYGVYEMPTPTLTAVTPESN